MNNSAAHGTAMAFGSTVSPEATAYADLRDHRHLRTAPAADALQLMSKLIDVGSTIFKKRHPEVVRVRARWSSPPTLRRRRCG